MVDGGYITLEERRSYAAGHGSALDTRRQFGLQGVMRDVRRAAVNVRVAQAASNLGRQSFSYRSAAAFAAGAIDCALDIVQRVVR